jgi:hypothetical protein
MISNYVAIGLNVKNKVLFYKIKVGKLLNCRMKSLPSH